MRNEFKPPVVEVCLIAALFRGVQSILLYASYSMVQNSMDLSTQGILVGYCRIPIVGSTYLFVALLQ